MSVSLWNTFLVLSQDEMRGSPDKYKSYVTTHLFLDDLNQ